MRKMTTLFLILALATPALAEPATPVYGQQVRYVGGTAPNLKEGIIGRLNTTGEEEIVFEAGEAKFPIPYGQIQKFRYEEKLARRLGVVATIVTVLVKHRQRRHFFEINYRDKEGTSQVAIFEVSKDNAQTIDAVLRARTQQNSARGSRDCSRYPGLMGCQSALHGRQP